MENFSDFVTKFLESGNYVALIIFLLIGAIIYLGRALKQKDEFILSQYKNLQESIDDLESEVKQLRDVLVEVRIRVGGSKGKEKGG